MEALRNPTPSGPSPFPGPRLPHYTSVQDSPTRSQYRAIQPGVSDQVLACTKHPYAEAAGRPTINAQYTGPAIIMDSFIKLTQKKS